MERVSVVEPETGDADATSTFRSETLRRTLERLNEMDADAADWDEIPAFLMAVQQLADAKLAEQSQSRESLQVALDELQTMSSELFPYFRMESALHWTAERSPTEDIMAVTEQVSILTADLRTYATLESLPRAATSDESRARHERIDALGRSIEESFARIDAVLGAHDDAPQPDDPDSAPETDQTPDEPEPQPGVAVDTVPDDETHATTDSEPTLHPEDEIGTATTTPVTAPAQPETDTRTIQRDDGELAAMPQPPTEPPAMDPAARSGSNPIPTTPSPSWAEITSATRAAEHIGGEDNREVWEAFALALIAEHDLPGAYWVMRWIESAFERTDGSFNIPIPPWLIAAAWGAQWVSTDSDRFVPDLFSIVDHHTIDSSIDAQVLMAFATAVCPALVSPHSGLGTWLDLPQGQLIGRFAGLDALRESLREFTRNGIILRPELLRGAIGREEHDASIRGCASAIRSWLEQSRARRLNYAPATDVWRALVQRGELELLLQPAARDDRACVDTLSDEIVRWRDSRFIDNLIETTHRRQPNRRGRTRPIEGAARHDLARNITEACDLASMWCTLVHEKRQRDEYGVDWLSLQAQELRSTVQQTSTDVDRDLETLLDPSAPAPQHAAAAVLTTAIQRLRTIIDSNSETVATGPWNALVRESNDLTSALCQRLLWLPEIGEADGTRNSPGYLRSVAHMLRETVRVPRSLGAASDGWIERGSFRHGQTVLAALVSEPDIAQLQRHFDTTLGGMREALSRRIVTVQGMIDQAAVDGALLEGDRVEYSAELVAIPVDEMLDFAAPFGRLDTIASGIQQARDLRLAHLRDEWPRQRAAMEQLPIDTAVREAFFQRVDTALNTMNIRVVDEYLAQARRAASGSALDESMTESTNSADDLKQFLTTRNDIALSLERLSLRSIQKGATDGKRLAPAIDFHGISARRLAEAAQGIGAWSELKRTPRAAEPDVTQWIQHILTFLGFSLQGGDSPIHVERRTTDSIHLRVRMSASDLAKPIPQFGSQSNNVYDVVCLWGRPGADMIGARLGEMGLTSHPVVAIYLGRLTRNQRPSIAGMARGRNLELAVLDELLLLYLAQRRDARLPAFLRCALPFAFVNPYTPVGDVPAEMFFGRQELVQELQQPRGTNLIYGGRQLGKSALLKRVQREFHRPEREQYAWITDLKGQYDPTRGTEVIWRLLRDRFRELKLFPAQSNPERSESIVAAIRTAMDQVPGRRIIVMFDEADEFLDEEARSGFRQISQLRQLMVDSDRRFRVIFTGLHDVQRFQAIPNQPLAQFGAAVCLGPLEPDAAYDLVTRPLRTLGYQFEHPDAVLRILSYTNYHPGLIQLFCQKLLNDRAKSTDQRMPPFTITQNDVDTVYRDPEVQRGVRDRFAWTLALDRRYQAVAWSMIVDQVAVRDSYARKYHPADALSLARDWWPRGFEGLSGQEFRVLLDEMCGLNVLLRDADGTYLLRSPNVVRLMGSESDIESDLLELSDQPAPRPVDMDSYHPPLSDTGQMYSPLTALESRALVAQQSGISLVLASDALGGSRIPTALSQLAPDVLRPFVMSWMSDIRTLADGHAFEQWLDDRTREHPQVVAVYPLSGHTADRMVEMIRRAKSFTQRRQRARDRWVRIIFFLAPDAAWTWYGIDVDVRADLTNAESPGISPRLWSENGIRQRLERHGTIALNDRCALTLRATGGWPTLLDAFLEQSGSDIDEERAAAFEARLDDSQSSIHQEFRSQLELTSGSFVPMALDALVALDEQVVPLSFFTPEMLGLHDDVTLDDCQRILAFLETLRCLRVSDDTIVIDPIVHRILASR